MPKVYDSIHFGEPWAPKCMNSHMLGTHGPLKLGDTKRPKHNLLIFNGNAYSVTISFSSRALLLCFYINYVYIFFVLD